MPSLVGSEMCIRDRTWPARFRSPRLSFGDQYRAYLRGQLTIHKNEFKVNRVWRGCSHLINYSDRLEVRKGKAQSARNQISNQKNTLVEPSPAKAKTTIDRHRTTNSKRLFEKHREANTLNHLLYDRRQSTTTYKRQRKSPDPNVPLIDKYKIYCSR